MGNNSPEAGQDIDLEVKTHLRFCHYPNICTHSNPQKPKLPNGASDISPQVNYVNGLNLFPKFSILFLIK